MPEVRQDPQTALLKLRRLGIFVLVDHVLFSALLHQQQCFGLNPSAHKGGQIEPCVAIQHQVIVHQLIGQIGPQARFSQLIAGNLGWQIPLGEAMAQFGVQIQTSWTIGQAHRSGAHRGNAT